VIQASFKAFIDDITPTEDDYQDARTKAEGVAKTLHQHYYGHPYTGDTKRIVGGYGKGTAVRPVRDVDLLFQLPNEEYKRYKDYESNGPSQLLQDVKGVLQTRYPATADKMRGDGHVVVIPFVTHTVELLPSWKTTSGKYFIPDTHDGGSWKLVDHTAEMVNVDGSNVLSDGLTRNLVRILKAWQHECSVPIKSLALELLAIGVLNGSQGSNYKGQWSRLITDSFGELVRRVDHVEPMPGTGDRFSYGNDWQSRATSAVERASRALELEVAGDVGSATREWQKVFGERYE
jgi:hypothetical protein